MSCRKFKNADFGISYQVKFLVSTLNVKPNSEICSNISDEIENKPKTFEKTIAHTIVLTPIEIN